MAHQRHDPNVLEVVQLAESFPGSGNRLSCVGPPGPGDLLDGEELDAMGQDNEEFSVAGRDHGKSEV
ncbi:MAG TPA: hypothetical protein DCQ33_04650 [Nitrospira sp.]|nr:hypothetical protein [Nitrospira sp.]